MASSRIMHSPSKARRLARCVEAGHIRRMTRKSAALVTLLAAAFALGLALASEYWGGLVPCALCLLERWPYRVVIVLALVAALMPRGISRPLLALAVVALLADAALAVV